MKEELRNLIDDEYNKIEVEDTNTNYQADINRKIEEQNIKVEEQVNNSTVVNEYLQKHNKNNINDLTSSEIDELINNIDKELENLE